MMKVDVVTCRECEYFEADGFPHGGNCYNYEVFGSDGEQCVGRRDDDYCSYGVRLKEKHQ